MADAIIRMLDGSIKSIPQDTIAALRGKLRGSVVSPGEDGYDAARSIWNAMVDRRPGLVVRCLGAADVIEAIKLANEEKLLVAVRSGGHNIAGNAVCDGGLMIDLSLMRSVRVDRAAKRAWVEPGVTLADVDKETQPFRLALPTGINSTTGIAGLTLGGGFGWITRKFGLTIDNLLSADLMSSRQMANCSAQVAPRTRTCSGRSEGAAGISASSPPSNFSFTNSVSKLSPALSCIRSLMQKEFSNNTGRLLRAHRMS